jgi:hypothetical protein
MEGNALLSLFHYHTKEKVVPNSGGILVNQLAHRCIGINSAAGYSFDQFFQNSLVRVGQ